MTDGRFVIVLGTLKRYLAETDDGGLFWTSDFDRAARFGTLADGLALISNRLSGAVMVEML